MEPLITFYVLFAVTTALTATYEIMLPIMTERQLDTPKLPDPWLWYITFFFIALLFAPLILMSCIVPPWGERFKATLAKILFDPSAPLN